MADEQETVEPQAGEEQPKAADVARGYLAMMSTPQPPETANALGLAANAWATLALVEAVRDQKEAMEWAAEYLASAIERGQG